MPTITTTIGTCACPTAISALSTHVTRAARGVATAVPAATSAATTTAAASTSSATTSARRRSFALSHSLLHIDALVADHVRLVEDDLVDGVRVDERDEAEATRPASGAVHHDLDLLDVAVLAEVVTKNLLRVRFGEAAQPQLVDSQVRLGGIALLAWHGTLRLDGFAVNGVRTLSLSCLQGTRKQEGYKTEATGTFGLFKIFI